MSRETTFWDPAAEAPEDWAAAQDALVARAIRAALDRSDEARGRLADAGIDASGAHGIAELSSVPVLAKDDLPDLQAANPPFAGMLGVGAGELRRIYQSPGPINDPEGRVPDYWRMAPALWAAGFRPGHTALNTFSYHLTPGGHMLDAGLREVGCVVVPGGVGNTAAQAAFAVQTGVVGYVGTPQFLLALLQKAAATDVPLSFERALVTGAPLPPSLREELQGEYGVAVFQAYGTADAGVLGFECDSKDGWHIAPGVVVEVLDPGSGETCPPGTPGEVVVTTPNPVYPLIRFGTGDLSALDLRPCVCGRTSPRLAGFLGRAGEGVKVRGMFVHPRQLNEVLGADGVVRYQGVVTSADHRDALTISVESQPGQALDVDDLAARLREATKIRVSVETVPPGTLDADARPLVDER